MKRTCLYRELLYTDNDFHLNLGFKFSPQTMVLVFNLISRKSSLHRQFLYALWPEVSSPPGSRVYRRGQVTEGHRDTVKSFSKGLNLAPPPFPWEIAKIKQNKILKKSLKIVGFGLDPPPPPPPIGQILNLNCFVVRRSFPIREGRLFCEVVIPLRKL